MAKLSRLTKQKARVRFWRAFRPNKSTHSNIDTIHSVRNSARIQKNIFKLQREKNTILILSINS